MAYSLLYDNFGAVRQTHFRPPKTNYSHPKTRDMQSKVRPPSARLIHERTMIRPNTPLAYLPSPPPPIPNTPLSCPPIPQTRPGPQVHNQSPTQISLISPWLQIFLFQPHPLTVSVAFPPPPSPPDFLTTNTKPIAPESHSSFLSCAHSPPTTTFASA